MEDSSELARPYALAAFKQAREEGKLAEWSAMLGLLAQIVRDPQMSGLISSPKVDEEQLVGLVLDIAGDRLSETGRNFVRVAAEYGRLPLVPAIAKVFDAERAKAEGRSAVQVTSAFALDEAQRRTIVDAMSKRLGTEVKVEVAVDESLIGGVVIRAGDLVIDASLRGRLVALRQALA